MASIMKKGKWIYIFFLLAPAPVFAQEKSSIDQFIADIFEQYVAESESDLDYESFYNDLVELSLNPINLNKTTQDELHKIPFLSDSQIENILYYVYRFGTFNSLYELQLVDGLDMTDIRRLLPFVKAGEAVKADEKLYLNEIWKYGKHDVLFRLDRDVERKSGYTITSGNDLPEYLGSAFYNSLKYQFRYKNRIQFGITMEKDAGEQWYGDTHKGYDFYSAYAQINQIGKLKTLILGDFRATFGQGLVLGNAFGSGKSSYVLDVSSYGAGIKKYSSTDENNFFRGVGASFHSGFADLSVFYSHKKIDAGVSGDVFSSFYRTGLHRTINELDKKNTVLQQVAGANISFTYKNFQLGFTSVYTALDKTYQPDPAIYNFHYYSGKTQFTTGSNYRFRWYKLNFFGETALTQLRSWATVDGISFMPVSQVNMVALYRNYAPGYDTFYANAFAENSGTKNESGFYYGVELHPVKKWKISAYADSYRFPWLRYGLDIPGYGKDYLMQIDFNPKRDLGMFLRFKTEKKQQNYSAGLPTSTIIDNHKSSLRYQIIYQMSGFEFKNILETNAYKTTQTSIEYGFTALQDVSYKFKTLPLKVDMRYQFFDAVHYDNRFYTYERDVLYAFSIPMIYGLGSRYYLNIRYEMNDKISFWFKIAQTVYADDRETTGTGTEQLQGNRTTDLRFLMRISL